MEQNLNAHIAAQNKEEQERRAQVSRDWRRYPKIVAKYDLEYFNILLTLLQALGPRVQNPQSR